MSVEVAGAPPIGFRFSALLSAVLAMRPVWLPALAVIVGNAVVQSILMAINAPSGFSPGFLLCFVVSAVSALALYAVLTAGALASVDGYVGLGRLRDRLRANLGVFSLWVLVQWVAILLVALVHPFLIPLVAVLTPFLPLAAMDGQRNALAANFRAIGGRFGRWVSTTLTLLIAAVVLFVLTVANTLFIKGTPAAAIFWLVIGVVAWWLLTAWALVYRKTEVGARG